MKQYFPGHKPSSPAFRIIPLNSTRFEDRIFQFDQNEKKHKDNKIKCRNENLAKYYQKIEPFDKTRMQPVLNFINDQLIKIEGRVPSGGEFEAVDQFDQLAMNVQEDLVIYDVKHQRVSNVHLCHANGWSAEGWVGKDFTWIHEGVKTEDDKLVIPNPEKFVSRIMKLKNSIERIGAISFNALPDLNRHPGSTQGENRHFDPNNPSLWMRVERQTVTSFPKQELFLFTIKTYFYDCASEEYKNQVIDIFENPCKNLYAKWFVEKYGKDVLSWLKRIDN